MIPKIGNHQNARPLRARQNDVIHKLSIESKELESQKKSGKQIWKPETVRKKSDALKPSEQNQEA